MAVYGISMFFYFLLLCAGSIEREPVASPEGLGRTLNCPGLVVSGFRRNTLDFCFLGLNYEGGQTFKNRKKHDDGKFVSKQQCGRLGSRFMTEEPIISK